MLNTVSMLVVVLAGIYFVVLSVVSLAAPSRASAFLMGFASSAVMHYVELFARVAVGFAFVVQAAHVPFPVSFTVFGWLLVGTTAGLFLVPWQWHRAFAQRAVPLALRYLPLYAAGSLALGGFVLWSVFRAVT